MFGCDAQNTGQSEYRGPSILESVWSAPVRALSVPVVDISRNAYAISANNRVLAIGAYGSVGWDYTIGGFGTRSERFGAAVDADGTLYAGLLYQEEGYQFTPVLLAMLPSGGEKWRFSPEDPWSSAISRIVLASDGTIYFTTNTRLFAVSQDGTEKWRAWIAADAQAPAVGADGTIYAVSGTGLHAIDPETGAELWHLPMDAELGTYPVVGFDGTIYVGGGRYAGGWGAAIFAAAPGGQLKWEFAAQEGGYVSDISVDRDGTIYAGSGGGLIAINADGSQRWLFPGIFQSKPAISSDGLIYAIRVAYEHDYHHVLYAIGNDGTEQGQLDLGSGGSGYVYSGVSITGDGWLLVGAFGSLYAIGSGEPPEPPSPVPFPGSGKGVWILRVWNIENGEVVGYKDPTEIINNLQSANIGWVIIKCGDGRFLWENEPKNAIGWVSDAISEFHAAGIKVFGWDFVYGAHGAGPVGTGGDPLEEAEVANSILNIPGIDGLVINAETDYDATSEETSKREQATQYMLSIRESHPEAFIAYNTFARINSHQYFPYVQFGMYCDAVMPMAYWKDRPTSPTNEVDIMHQQWKEKYEAWQDTPNRYAIKPIIPVGQSSNDPGTVYCSGSEIIEFCNALSDYGYADMSIYRYDKFTDEAWDAYSTCFGEFLIKAFCPVDLLITDPDGLQISKHTNQISGAIYLEFDINRDDELDDVVAIRETLTGDYIIQVIPQDEILPTDTFSLKVAANGETVVLFEDVAIKDIPAQPYIIRSSGDEIIPIIPVTVDFNPNTLNPRSPSVRVTVYIELPVGHGYETEEINVTNLMLNSQVAAEAHPTKIGDYDEDGIPDLMVKFNLQVVVEMLEPGVQMVQLTGELSDGTLFAGNDTVRVLDSKSDESVEPEFDWAMPEVFIADLEENLQPTADGSVDTGGEEAFNVEQAVAFMLSEADGIIGEFGPESFNNEESAFELACALDDVFTMLDEGMYFEVMVILEGDILERMDGCTNIGQPDEDDWITSIEGQALLYPLVVETIEILESLL
jgi:hypothetical protein